MLKSVELGLKFMMTKYVFYEQTEERKFDEN